MRLSILNALLFGLICVNTHCKTRADLITDEEQAKTYLADVNLRLAEQYRLSSEAQWAYATNITDETSAAQIAASKVFNDFQKSQANETKQYDWSGFEENLQRQFEKLAVIGTSALDSADEDEYTKVTNEMTTLYSSAKVCVSTRGCNLELDPDLDDIMSSSKNYSELLETWVNWRDAAGKPIRQNYITYFTLGNKAAQMNSIPTQEFKTLDDLWLFSWETPDIKNQTALLWEQMKPFYQKIHTYVRMKLKIQYPDQMPSDGTIPAHLLGNMWAQSWSNIMNTVDGVDPYPDLAPIDVTDALVEQGYTAQRMFELSDEFFGNLNLERMTQTFWDKSMIVKPSDRTVVCHASAWDFYGTEDWRIKQCTNINMADLITIHHEMGHIEYYMQYKDQPTVYRRGANPGFHEAIGDLLALSVSTPKHLQTIGLLDPIDQSDLGKINTKYQLKMALDKVMFLPFAYIMDKWRWDVFSGEVSSDDMNRHWWQLRGDYQGLSPPVKRSEDDFDPGCKYHIPASVEYIRYFVSHILQFQFHKTLCSFGQKDVPLYECDINNDTEAGLALKTMLQKGSSEKWPQQLQELTGSGSMDVTPLTEYFQLLETFIDEQIAGETVGWTYNVDDYFDSSTTSSTSTSTPTSTSTSTSSSTSTPTPTPTSDPGSGGAVGMTINVLLLTFATIPAIIALNFV